jgi:hypothetical protein
MYGYAPRYPNPPPLRARVRVGLAVLASLFTVPLIAWGAFVVRRESRSYVVFANDRAEALGLVIDGAPRGKIPAHGSLAVDVVPGLHHVAAGDDRGAFMVPVRTVGEPGFRGLYNVGAGPGLAVVTKYYAVGRIPFEDRVETVATGTR